MHGRPSLWLASSIAEDARRRAAWDRRAGGYRTVAAVVRTPRETTLRVRLGRLLRPSVRHPNPVR